MIQRRGLLILGWFALLVAWNIATHWSENTDKNGPYVLLQAIGNLTTPLELLLSAVAVSAIILSKRKPMRDRLQSQEKPPVAVVEARTVSPPAENASRIVPHEPAANNFSTSESGPINEPSRNQEQQTVGGGMNRKQRICITAAITLLALTGLCPPWGDFTYGSQRFGFLFDPNTWRELNWPILWNEWAIIVVLMGGLFLIFRDPKQSSPRTSNDATLTTQSKVRWRSWLTLVLAVLVACLSLTTYAAVRKVKRLEAGIQNIKAMIGELPPTQPVGEEKAFRALPPPSSAEEAQGIIVLMAQDHEKRIGQLRQIKEGLEKLD